jgi:hypothetical protein
MMEAKAVTVDTADTTGDVDDVVCGQRVRAVTTVGAGEQGAGLPTPLLAVPPVRLQVSTTGRSHWPCVRLAGGPTVFSG